MHAGAPILIAFRDGCNQITVPLEMACNQYAAGIIREMAKADNLMAEQSIQTASSVSQVGVLPNGDVFTLSSEVDIGSNFESCEEEELMTLITPTRGRKRCRYDDTDFEDEDDDDDELAIRAPSNSRDPKK